jgi:hypothetical protein
MSDEPRESWDERFIKRLKRAAKEGEIARMVSQALGFAVIIIFWMTSVLLISDWLRPPD